MTNADPHIIDAHHHIWRLHRTPWLAGPPVPRIFGSYDAIRRDYLIDEYAADAAPCGVSKSIHVQANVAPGTEAEEVDWASSSGAQAGLVQGVVAFADLAAPDLAATLDQLAARPALRGIRQQLHWHPDPALRYADSPDAMLHPAWQRGLREVTSRRLLFELQVFPAQYPHALALIDAFPDTTFVLLHAGMLEDRSADGTAQWRRGLAQFAARPNVFAKLSGLGTFTRQCTRPLWQPVIEQTVDAFGPSRCMFGSNFPIEKLWTTYANLIDVVRASLRPYSGDERRQILHDVAVRVYRL